MPDSDNIAVVEKIQPDLELALPSAGTASEIPLKDPLKDLVAAVESTTAEAQQPRQIGHSNKDLLKRAHEINERGQFIFTCYSELNTFLLLRSQDDILKLENKLNDSIEGIGEWTDEDFDNLQQKLRQYCNFLSL